MRLRVGHQHSQFWPILAQFVDYYSLFWRPGVNSTINKPWGALTCRSSTLAVFLDFDPISWTITQHFVVRKGFPWLSNPKVCLRVGPQDSQFGRLWPVSWTITQFPGFRGISMIDEPRVRFRFGHQHSRFLSILACFVDYYSLFWAPGVISTIKEPRGVLTCRSSTLTALADSGPFHGLLPTIFGSGSDFND